MSSASRPACGLSCLLRRGTAWLLLFTMTLTITGCQSWRVVPLSKVSVHQEKLIERHARFTTDDGVYTMSIEEVDFPWVRGRLLMGSRYGRSTAIDLREVTKLEVLEKQGSGETVLIVLASVAAFLLLMAIIVALTKESCPIVYADTERGRELVGEAYAGAAFGSIQRADLLPLPDLPAGTARVELVNEARETQYTDRLQLVVADHDPGLRAVSTWTQELALVGSKRAPVVATDLQGRAVAAVASEDDAVWSSDVETLASQADPPLRDGLMATFDAPVADADPVLEIRAANTALLDVVFGRFFALMGDDIDRFLEEGNQPDAGERIQRWRHREGVDLKVEVRGPDGWETVAMVPTPGPVALRNIAIPLPKTEPGQSDVTVRVSAGTGFWRVDALSLSTREAGELEVRRFDPVTARNDGGSDERDVLRAVDGEYQVLSRPYERVHLGFEPEPVVAGRTRSFFLFTHGYYNVHPPAQRERSLLTLKTIRDEEGALARFGLDLVRRYTQMAREAPTGPAAGVGAGAR